MGWEEMRLWNVVRGFSESRKWIFGVMEVTTGIELRMFLISGWRGL